MCAKVKNTYPNLDGEEKVECWKCTKSSGPKGKYKKRTYHNDYYYASCWSRRNACDGSGLMKFKDVPDAHKKYYNHEGEYNQ